MITFRLAHNIFDCLYSPFSIIAGMMFGRAISKGNIHIFTEICQIDYSYSLYLGHSELCEEHHAQQNIEAKPEMVS